MSYDNSVSLEKNKRIFKIIVIGDSSVGKTCLTYRFCGGKFPMKTEATIGVDFREKTVEVDNETVKLLFWDTAGFERNRQGMLPLFFRKVHLVVFVYDITVMETFKNLNYWLQEWMLHKEQDLKTKMVLIGNKNDNESERQVSTAAGRRYARENDMVFFETTAVKEEVPCLEEMMNEMAKLAKKAAPVLPRPEPTITVTGRIVTDEEPTSLCC